MKQSRQICIFVAIFALLACKVQGEVDYKTLVEKLRENEQAVKTFKGTMKKQYVQYIEYTQNGRWERVRKQPFMTSEYAVSFIYDWSNNNYKTEISSQYYMDGVRKGAAKNVERKYGNNLHEVLYDQIDVPYEQIISSPHTAMSLNYRSPFHLRAHMVWAWDESNPDGFLKIPLSEMIYEDEKRTIIYDDEEIIEGQRCLKVVTVHPMPELNSQYMAFVWLGLDLNLTIVKWQTLNVPLENTEDHVELKAAWPTLEDLAQEMETRRPELLVVGEDFFEVEPDVWVASKMVFYPIYPMDPTQFETPNYDEASFLELKKRHTHTAGLRQGVVLVGITRVLLDKDSVEINDPSHSRLIEKEILSENVPTYNAITRTQTFPEDTASGAE